MWRKKDLGIVSNPAEGPPGHSALCRFLKVTLRWWAQVTPTQPWGQAQGFAGQPKFPASWQKHLASAPTCLTKGQLTCGRGRAGGCTTGAGGGGGGSFAGSAGGCAGAPAGGTSFTHGCGTTAVAGGRRCMCWNTFCRAGLSHGGTDAGAARCAVALAGAQGAAVCTAAKGGGAGTAGAPPGGAVGPAANLLINVPLTVPIAAASWKPRACTDRSAANAATTRREVMATAPRTSQARMWGAVVGQWVQRRLLQVAAPPCEDGGISNESATSSTSVDICAASKPSCTAIWQQQPRAETA
mmetsp:Transcript_91509/g.284703  ORF Transcript_91509/g.284703 Transcript_91509/m.284703 type:complete len:298 (-) Transcript_91509:20-913(-)